MKSKQLDQFYTLPSIADNIIADLTSRYDLKSKNILEPSAGNGSFSDYFHHDNYRLFAYDIDPLASYIKKEDFLTLKLDLNPSETITIGNPPFGRNSSLAVKFFNKCTIHSHIICFIVPKTFKKNSIHCRLNPNFHLVYEKDMPKKSFIFNQKAHDVPCCYQIWEYRVFKREFSKEIKKSSLVSFVHKKDADFAVRRVGWKAGVPFLDNIDTLSISSNHFLKNESNLPTEKIVDIIRKIDFRKIVNSTAGTRSLSKAEFMIHFLIEEHKIINAK